MPARHLRMITAVAAVASGAAAVATSNGWFAVAGGVLALLSGASTLGPSADERAEQVHDGIDLREPDPSPATHVDPDPPPTAPVGRPELVDEKFLLATLRGRIAIAKRSLRPLALVHILIVSKGEPDPGPIPPGDFLVAAEATLRDSDVVGRYDDGVFVFILEDTGEDGAVWTTERLRRELGEVIGSRSFRAGVAAYPNHGLDESEVSASVSTALAAALQWDRDRIEVATST